MKSRLLSICRDRLLGSTLRFRLHPYCTVFEVWRAERRCSKLVKRHSNSVDPETASCRRCGGKLRFLGRFNRDGSLAAKKPLNIYSQFVRDNFSSVQKEHPPGG